MCLQRAETAADMTTVRAECIFGTSNRNRPPAPRTSTDRARAADANMQVCSLNNKSQYRCCRGLFRLFKPSRAAIVGTSKEIVDHGRGVASCRITACSHGGVLQHQVLIPAVQDIYRTAATTFGSASASPSALPSTIATLLYSNLRVHSCFNIMYPNKCTVYI